MKQEWQEPEKDNRNFANKAKKENDFSKHFHNNDKAKFMPNRLPTGDIGAQFLDLEWGPPVSPLFMNTFNSSERLRSSIE